jgi:small subunit ribosomal protein S24
MNQSSSFHTTSLLEKKQAGRHRPSPKGDKPLTYEMANHPHTIAMRKSWNSWNTSILKDGVRLSETIMEDFTIRRFMAGTWHKLFLSDIIIKRRGNLICISGIVIQSLLPRKMYFLIGYTEEILSYLLKCPVKLELQTVSDRKDVVFRYI